MIQKLEDQRSESKVSDLASMRHAHTDKKIFQRRAVSIDPSSLSNPYYMEFINK